MKYLTMFLSGPLQSWGVDSKFSVRDTLPYPSKSGLFGMLLAASGDSGAQTELLARLAPAKLTVYGCEPSQQLHDFHMVGNGYEGKGKWEDLHILRVSGGAKRKNASGTLLTHRYYLQDASFFAMLELEDELGEKFAVALQNPVYDVHLGRKCCVPTRRIYEGLFSSEDKARQCIQSLAKKYDITLRRRVTEVETKQEGAILLNDVPVEFGRHKRYRDRWVVEDEISNDSL